MPYIKYGVNLSDGQKDKLARALSNKSAITIRLTKSDLTGSDDMMLTKTQLKRIKKAMNNSTGVDLKISKTKSAMSYKKVVLYGVHYFHSVQKHFLMQLKQ